jgi:hypothetical protein
MGEFRANEASGERIDIIPAADSGSFLGSLGAGFSSRKAGILQKEREESSSRQDYLAPNAWSNKNQIQVDCSIDSQFNQVLSPVYSLAVVM